MELLQSSNWQLTKSLLVLIGLWPFQRNNLQVLLSRVTIISIISIIIPEVIKVISVWGDVTAVIECAPLSFFHLMAMMKMLSYYFYLSKLKIILKHLQENWLSDLSHMEMEIIQCYGKNNRRVTHAYACVIFGCTLMICGTPLVPKILDIIVPLNESRPIELLYSVEYFLDPDKYKVPLFIHAYLISPFPSLVTVAFDTTYFHCVQYGCSMFAIIRHRMQIIGGQAGVKIHRDITDRKTHQLLTDCTKMHVITLRYCEKLESLYTFALLPVVVINTLILSVTGFHTLIKLNDTPEAFKYGSFTIGGVLHLFLFTYTGQDLTDHSESIHQFTYNNKWYTVSPKLKDFFILAMIRSKKTCKITAGKIYIFSIENFSKVMKLSVSYFTVLVSLQ